MIIHKWIDCWKYIKVSIKQTYNNLHKKYLIGEFKKINTARDF